MRWFKPHQMAKIALYYCNSCLHKEHLLQQLDWMKRAFGLQRSMCCCFSSKFEGGGGYPIQALKVHHDYLISSTYDPDITL